MNSKPYMLVDGTALVYRAFYAIRELSTAAGEPTNALFGFIRALRQLGEQWQPSHWLVAFDGGRPEARLQLLETYKAQRPEMPDPLRCQLPAINEYLACARIPMLLLKGQEADDIIATAARRVAPPDAAVLIATSDKDMFQLVDGRTRIVPLAKTGEVMGPAEVQAKTGVLPDRIVPWLALVGDSSDNIPGVPGVGAKTAAKWLEQHGSLDGIWANLAQLKPPRLQAVMEQSRAVILKNLELVRLRDDLPLPIVAEDLARREPDPDRLRELYRRYELSSLLRELEQPELKLF